MTTPPPPEVTRLLIDWSDGDRAAFEKLMPLVHDELRRLARHYMNRENPGHTLQPTALVNEAYLRLIDQSKVRWQNRAHFFAIAAQTMRRILIDHARQRRSQRAGGELVKVSLVEAAGVSNERPEDVLALDEALKALARIDEQQSRVVELRFFGGLTIEETAEALGLSHDMVKREWATAKAWLYREMGKERAVTDAERWQRVKAVLHSVLQLERDARPAFLDEACRGDQSLRGEVEQLAASHDQAESFFETPAAARAAQSIDDTVTQVAPGRAMGPYEILSPLGAGGMGEVFLAHDARLGRNVALKMLLPWLTRDPERVRRFQQEARTASGLNHPGIVTIFEVGEFDATHFIATEFVDGVTLRSLISRTPMKVETAVDIAQQAASALAAAHAAGIVHRDIKPENLMVRRDGYVKVLDFGIAKLSQRSDAKLVHTEPGTVMGTVNYMSPEQARGVALDGRSDIWSLGVVLYEMLAGYVPFSGETGADVMVAILEREPAEADVPPELETVIRKALQKDPARRYRSADEMAADLRAIKREFEFRSPAAGNVVDERPAAIAVTNLTSRQQMLIGRGEEVAAITDLLLDENVRLITLTGPGGTGKTRLSQHIGRDVLHAFADGVFFVGLAPITGHERVASAIAQVVGVQETSQRGFVEGLKHYLREKEMLLVLDNFEHVIDAAPLVAELSEECRALKILVTSRAALRVGGEREFMVPPLAQSGAELLFLQRVAAIRPDFRPSDEDTRVVADICARLDGLPLALELAAARARVLSLDEIRARMSHGLDLLKVRSRDMPARQQTMRAAIAWSYDLLGGDEKTLFHRLSVFSGGSTMSASEAVCGEDLDVLDALESLVDENLVQRRETAAGAWRFMMLETIREFGIEHLESSGEAEELRRRQARYFLHLALEAEPHLMSAGREEWLSRLEAEHNNLRAALRWAIDHKDVETGLQLAGALRWYWYFRGHIGEGYNWCTEILAMPSSPAHAASRARALLSAGSLAFYYSNPAAACPLLEESVSLWRLLDRPRDLAYTVLITALPVSLSRNDFHSARALAEEGIRLFRGIDDRWGLALALTYGGVILWTEPSLEKEATAMFEESVEIFTALGDGWGIGGATVYLGAIRHEHGDIAAARAMYEQFIELSRQSKDTWRLASGLDLLADLLLTTGETERAAELTRESLVLQGKLGRALSLKAAWARMRRGRAN